MANTFTPVKNSTPTGLGTAGVPLPGVATMGSGGVSNQDITTPGQSYNPIAPLPVTGTGQVSTAI